MEFLEAPGSSPTRASGRCAARGATSRTRRCSRGSRSTARSQASSGSDSTGPLDRWRRMRDEIHDGGLPRGLRRGARHVHPVLRLDELDASTLLIPLVGFLPADDPRVVGTIEAIQSDLMRDGFVARYTAARAERRSTASRAARESSCRARSGSSTRCCCRAATTRPARSSRSCSASATTSACSRRSTTRRRSACSATSRRRSPTSASSTRRTTSRTTTGPMPQRLRGGD